MNRLSTTARGHLDRVEEKGQTNVALIGNGYWGGKIERYVTEHLALTCVADTHTDLRREVWDTDVNGVIIATPIETHYELTKQALLHGKHVLVEKPITTDVGQAIELKELAERRGLKIGVEYTQSFSPAVLKAAEEIEKIGKLRFVEMSTKHLGRFYDSDVYWVLASHHLSILALFIPLEAVQCKFDNQVLYEGDVGRCTTGSIGFECKTWDAIGGEEVDVRGRVDVSLNFPGKEMMATFYGDNGTLKYNPVDGPSLQLTLYNRKPLALPDELTEAQEEWRYDEMNSLQYSLAYFKDLMEGNAVSNLETAIQITRLLSDRGCEMVSGGGTKMNWWV